MDQSFRASTTQDAFLDMIDAIDADMNARLGDAEQRNCTAYTQPLDQACMRAFKNSIHSEVAKHFAEFFLEAESNFERVNLDSTNSLLRECRQPATSKPLAGDSSIGMRWSSVSFSQKQNAFWRRENCFPRGTAEEPHAPDAEAEATDSEPEARVMEPLADDHSSDSDDAPTGVEESAAPAAPAVAAAPKRAAMSLLERLQAIRVIYGSTPS